MLPFLFITFTTIMAAKLSFFNWSLSKLLATETGIFNLAKIRILYFLLLLSLVKIVIAITAAAFYDQTFQLWRAGISLVLYLTFFKLILANKNNLNIVTHLMIVSGLFITWSILFVSAQRINIVSLQFVFMIILSSFYLLNRKWGLIYSILAILPIIFFILFFNEGDLQFIDKPNPLALPARFLIITLNFVTFTVAHYLYREAFQNIIDSKEELNAQLKIALDKAEKLAQTKADFLSTMSHELRTPLNMVIGMTELLRETPHDKEQEENLKMLNFGALNLHSLINDVLDFNKLESGKLQLEKVNVNLNELMTTLTNGMQTQVKDKALTLGLELDKKLSSLVVITDPIRLSQIVYNLLSNGIKFTSKGNVSLQLMVKGIDNENVNIQFVIKDSGIGISKEKQAVIFEPFTQASTNTTRNYGGTGLGLSIVKQLLELFNSNLKLESKLGEGTIVTFDITLPIGTVDVINEDEKIQESNTLHNLKMLIVEDNVLNTFLIKKICSKWNVLPVMVENGFDAINEVMHNKYDVVLMDLHMPEMDGYAASKAIRLLPNGSFNQLNIIAFTASVSNDLESKIKEAGMNDFLRKPFKSNDLYIKLLAIATQ